jgi:hypothetical protein
LDRLEGGKGTVMAKNSIIRFNIIYKKETKKKRKKMVWGTRWACFE